MFDEMKIAELKEDDGFDKLVTFMDAKLGKDELEESLEKFDDFENFKRS